MHIEHPPSPADAGDEISSRAWRLLLADDSRAERSLLAELLRSEGYEVDEAEDGHSAMLLLRSRPVDLLLKPVDPEQLLQVVGLRLQGELPG